MRREVPISKVSRASIGRIPVGEAMGIATEEEGGFITTRTGRREENVRAPPDIEGVKCPIEARQRILHEGAQGGQRRVNPSHHHRESSSVTSPSDGDRRYKIRLHQPHTICLMGPPGAHPTWYAIVTTTIDQRGLRGHWHIVGYG